MGFGRLEGAECSGGVLRPQSSRKVIMGRQTRAAAVLPVLATAASRSAQALRGERWMRLNYHRPFHRARHSAGQPPDRWP